MKYISRYAPWLSKCLYCFSTFQCDLRAQLLQYCQNYFIDITPLLCFLIHSCGVIISLERLPLRPVLGAVLNLQWRENNVGDFKSNMPERKRFKRFTSLACFFDLLQHVQDTFVFGNILIINAFIRLFIVSFLYRMLYNWIDKDLTSWLTKWHTTFIQPLFVLSVFQSVQSQILTKTLISIFLTIARKSPSK